MCILPGGFCLVTSVRIQVYVSFIRFPNPTFPRFFLLLSQEFILSNKKTRVEISPKSGKGIILQCIFHVNTKSGFGAQMQTHKKVGHLVHREQNKAHPF